MIIRMASSASESELFSFNQKLILPKPTQNQSVRLTSGYRRSKCCYLVLKNVFGLIGVSESAASPVPFDPTLLISWR